MVKKKEKKKRPQFNIWLEATKKFGPALDLNDMFIFERVFLIFYINVYSGCS
jgi:hypothetical protein